MDEIIETLKAPPYLYNISKIDGTDNEYSYPCADGIRLCIHTKKPTTFWVGLDPDGKKITQKNFSPFAQEATAKFIKDYNRVKADAIPDFMFAAGDGEPADDAELEPELSAQTQNTGGSCTQLTTISQNSQEGMFTQEQMEAMRKTVAKGATPAEFTMFMYLANRYNLDPFLHEIFFSPDLKTIMTSRDGYLKIAHAHTAFQGIQSMAVCANDDFELDVANHTVHHKFGKGERGPVIGAWAIVYRLGRFPVIAYASLQEHRGNSRAWKYVSAMICKCAEAFALKRQFGINGLVTQEEMDVTDTQIINAEYVKKEVKGTDEKIEVHNNVVDAAYTECESAVMED